MRNLQPELNHNCFRLASGCVRILLELISIYLVISLEKAASRLNLKAFQPINFEVESIQLWPNQLNMK